MSEIGKVCTECGLDVAQLKRVKDQRGRYHCEPCWQTIAQATRQNLPPQNCPKCQGATQISPDGLRGRCTSCGFTFVISQQTSNDNAQERLSLSKSTNNGAVEIDLDVHKHPRPDHSPASHNSGPPALKPTQTSLRKQKPTYIVAGLAAAISLIALLSHGLRGSPRVRHDSTKKNDTSSEISQDVPRQEADRQLGESNSNSQSLSQTTVPQIADPALAVSDGKLVVMTEDDGGLKEGNVLYKVGMSSDDFIRQFGAPEHQQPDCLDYYSDGIRVFLNSSGNVRAYVVYFLSQSVAENTWRAANAVSDKGVQSGATYRQIIKACGEPEAKHDIGAVLDLPAQTELRYDWGQNHLQDNTLSYIFVGKSN